jgi:hypothetical protein
MRGGYLQKVDRCMCLSEFEDDGDWGTGGDRILKLELEGSQNGRRNWKEVIETRPRHVQEREVTYPETSRWPVPRVKTVFQGVQKT